nr:DUF1799 domain-containing protein [Duganella aceris]
MIETEGALAREQRVVDEALAAIGLVAVTPVTKLEELYLWPENVRSWNLFHAVGTQWNIGANGAVGLNYQGVEMVMRNWRIKRRDEQRVFREIQVMERATLRAWEERKDG